MNSLVAVGVKVSCATQPLGFRCSVVEQAVPWCGTALLGMAKAQQVTDQLFPPQEETAPAEPDSFTCSQVGRWAQLHCPVPTVGACC